MYGKCFLGPVEGHSWTWELTGMKDIVYVLKQVTVPECLFHYVYLERKWNWHHYKAYSLTKSLEYNILWWNVLWNNKGTNLITNAAFRNTFNGRSFYITVSWKRCYIKMLGLLLEYVSYLLKKEFVVLSNYLLTKE